MQNHTYLRLMAYTGLVSLLPALPALAQNDSLSVAGNSINLFNPGPYGVDDLVLDPSGDEAFRLTLGNVHFLPRIDVVGIHEDNALLSSKDKEKATYMVLAPGLMAKVGSAAGNYAYLDYAADIPFGDDPDDSNVVSHQGTALGHYEKSKSTLNAWYRFQDARGTDAILGQRLTKQVNTVYGGYDHKTTAKTALGLHGTYSAQDYDDDDNLSDFTDYNVGGRAHWLATGKTKAFLAGSVGQVDVDANDASFGDAEYIQADLGLGTQLGSRWDLSGTIGYQWREFDDDRIEKKEGWVSALNLDGLISEMVRGGVGFWSTIQPAVNETGATLSEMRLEPSLAVDLLSDALVLSITGVFGWIDYESPDIQADINEQDSGTVFDNRKDEYTGFTLAADWFATRKVKLGAGYSFLDHNTKNEQADQDPLDYTANRYFVRGRYNF